jgi:pimeloyl-ACP methyl ester carboxylesterase
MPIEKINGVGILIEEFGSGEPLVLVHGSWADHMEWPLLVPLLAPRFRVTVYDRRGHSQSERLPTQGSVREDVADLGAIIERAGAPAHVLGNSLGAAISLRLAGERPELIRTLIVHEPPLFDLLRHDPETKPLIEAFDEGARGRGRARNWKPRRRREAVRRWHRAGPGQLGQLRAGRGEADADQQRADLPRRNARPRIADDRYQAAVRVLGPVLLTGGSGSPPIFAPVLDKLAAVLPSATRKSGASAARHASAGVCGGDSGVYASANDNR